MLCFSITYTLLDKPAVAPKCQKTRARLPVAAGRVQPWHGRRDLGETAGASGMRVFA